MILKFYGAYSIHRRLPINYVNNSYDELLRKMRFAKIHASIWGYSQVAVEYVLSICSDLLLPVFWQQYTRSMWTNVIIFLFIFDASLNRMFLNQMVMSSASWNNKEEKGSCKK